MALIHGIELPSAFVSSVGATSPEETAKQFMKLATQGMATVFSEALRVALSDAGGENSDWKRLVKGCLIEIHGENPPGTPIQSCVAIPSDNGLGAVEFSLAVKGDF